MILCGCGNEMEGALAVRGEGLIVGASSLRSCG